MHTKGPWNRCGDEIIGGMFRNTIAIVRPIVDDTTGYSVDHTRANARLIAETPTMFEFISKIATLFKWHEGTMESLVEDAQEIVSRIKGAA